MYVIHEGEVLLKEQYGSSSRERLYVQPPGQRNIVILDEKRFSNNVANWFGRIFLPQGYPESVSNDYTPYQIWDTAQAFCSTISGTLATQEVLRGVGVGDTHTTPLAATVTWVIKDGCGHIGRIFFAYSHGTYLDAYSKKWRLYADTLNDAAMCIEIALPLFKDYTLFALCISTMMKAIVGVAGGATRMAMTQHHALRGNMADVSAKDAAQETAVNLVASVTALLIISIIGNSLIVFIITIILHIIFNYLAVRAVCLRTLNEPRFLLVIDTYLREEVIPTPCDINRSEPVIFYQLGSNLLDLRLCGFKIKIGHSLKKIMNFNSKAFYLSNIRKVYAERPYILYPNTATREMYILLKEHAETEDSLCSYFHAVLLSTIICAINEIPLSTHDQKNPSGKSRPFAEVCSSLQAADWTREVKETADFSNFLYDPSYDLIKYVDDIVQKEWRRVIWPGLSGTGWDVSKHLLMTDEWRIRSHSLQGRSISSSSNVLRSSLKLISNQSLINVEGPDKADKETYTIEPTDSKQSLKEPITTNRSNKRDDAR